MRGRLGQRHARVILLPLPYSQTQHYFLFCFLLKFSLTICSCLICFGFTLHESCKEVNTTSLNLTTCSSIMLHR